jgi:hypothetical protein
MEAWECRPPAYLSTRAIHILAVFSSVASCGAATDSTETFHFQVTMGLTLSLGSIYLSGLAKTNILGWSMNGARRPSLLEQGTMNNGKTTSLVDKVI